MIRKRIAADGTIYYQAKVKVRGAPLYESFATKSLAEKWENSVRYNRDQGRAVSSGPVSIEAMFDAYKRNAERLDKAPSTLQTADLRYRAYILPFFSGIDMRTVTIDDVERFLETVKKEPAKPHLKELSHATVNRIRALLRVMYSTVIKKQLFDRAITTNPFDAVEEAEENSPPIQYWKREEARRFLETHRASEYYPLYFTLLNTGLRIGEAVALHADQVDASAGILLIDRQFDVSSGKVVYRLKGKSHRYLGITPELGEVLYPLLNGGPLFKGHKGGPLLPDYFRRGILPKACEQAQVKPLHPHGFRHTFAAQYLMDGGKMWDLSNILGHSSITVTERYYAHFDIAHVKGRMIVGGAPRGAEPVQKDSKKEVA